MAAKLNTQVSVVIPNWNGKESLADCINSLLKQSQRPRIIVVENGSTDGSGKFLEDNFPDVDIIYNSRNLGFAGGVNVGIRQAIRQGDKYVALFNNDAVADRDWLKNLVKTAETNEEAGIVTCKFMTIDKKHLDSTGDLYTNWGLPFPRGRGEQVSKKYDKGRFVFAASGGASLYRVKMLKEIGLFDEDFFAYYEDIDMSFRAQLAGWKVMYEPAAMAYHQIGATSGNIKGFTTYQTLKNQPLLLFKNVPHQYLLTIGCRFLLAHILFFGRAITRGKILAALKGELATVFLLFKKIPERRLIQKSKIVSDEYIWSIITHDLPPNAHALRSLRAKFGRFFRNS